MAYWSLKIELFVVPWGVPESQTTRLRETAQHRPVNDAFLQHISDKLSDKNQRDDLGVQTERDKFNLGDQKQCSKSVTAVAVALPARYAVFTRVSQCATSAPRSRQIQWHL